MPRRFRDAAISTGVLLALFGTLVAVNADLRDRVTQYAAGSTDQWLAPGRMVSGMMANQSASALGYAANNSYQVGFVIGAGLLLILMLRA
jgi:hypothetical protein